MPLNIRFLDLSEQFPKDSKASSNQTRAISVRVIEVYWTQQM